MERRTLYSGVLAATIVALTMSGAAFTATPRAEQAAGLRAQVPGRAKDAKLDSRLAGVARVEETSGDAAALASARAKGLKVKGGRIRAVVIAKVASAADAAVRGHGGAIEARYGNST